MELIITFFVIGGIVAVTEFIHDCSVKHTEKVANKVIYLKFMK